VGYAAAEPAQNQKEKKTTDARLRNSQIDPLSKNMRRFYHAGRGVVNQYF